MVVPSAVLRSRLAASVRMRSQAHGRPLPTFVLARSRIATPTRLYSSTTPSTPPAPTPSAPSIELTSAAVPSPSPRTGRFRRFFLWLVLLGTAGYAGGVYYSLVSDNWRDFFTEYIPFSEEIVAYLEEREFQKRIKSSPNSKLYPQIRGEEKVSIPGKSGVSSRIVDESLQTGQSTSSRYASALDAAIPAPAAALPQAAPAKETKPAPATVKIDHLHLGDSHGPEAQKVVEVINSLIDQINSDANGQKYSAAIASAKTHIADIWQALSTAKASVSQTVDDKIKALHAEFDEAAREHSRRKEIEIGLLESQWKEEYETERERLSKGYDAKLAAESEKQAAVHAQQLKSTLLEQAIDLYRYFGDTVQDRVEAERDGRLSRLAELEKDVLELQKLTGKWNAVVDENLQTQRLLVAVEALRAKLEKTDRPVPFVNDLVAVTEISADNDVISAAIGSIHPSSYQRGISTPAELVDRFRRVASEVRKAAMLPEDAGVASHIASLALSKVMFRKQGLPEGNDVESILARTELYLEEGKLDDAAREMNGLSGWAKTLSRDWLTECRKVLEVRQAIEVISAESRLKSLLLS